MAAGAVQQNQRRSSHIRAAVEVVDMGWLCHDDVVLVDE